MEVSVPSGDFLFSNFQRDFTDGWDDEKFPSPLGASYFLMYME